MTVGYREESVTSPDAARAFEALRLSDRALVQLLTSCFPPALVDDALRETSRREQRRRRLPAGLVVYFTLALWLFRGDGDSYSRVWRRMVDGMAGSWPDGPATHGAAWPPMTSIHGHDPEPAASSLVRARERLGPEPLRLLFDAAARSVARRPGTVRAGLRVVVLDWDVLDLADTAPNRLFAPSPVSATGTRQLPQIRWAALADAESGALLRAAFRPAADGVEALVADLVSALGSDRLVVLPRRADVDPVARQLRAAGTHVLWRRPGVALLEPHPVRVDRDVHPTGDEEVATPDEHVVRWVADTRDPLGLLITDVVDRTAFPDALLIALDQPPVWPCAAVTGRAGAGNRRHLMLRSRDPDGVAQEFWAMVAVHQARRMAFAQDPVP